MRFFVLCIKAKEFARQTTPCRPVEILRTELTTRRFKALHSFTLGNCLEYVRLCLCVNSLGWESEYIGVLIRSACYCGVSCLDCAAVYPLTPQIDQRPLGKDVGEKTLKSSQPPF